MNAYSLDLREKIVESVKKDVPKAETARRFGVDRATVKRYCKKLDQRGTLEPRKAPGRAPKLDEKARRLLLEDLEEGPWATHSQRAEILFAACGVRVSEATVCRTLKRLSVSRKKDQGGERTGRVLEESMAHRTRRHRRRTPGVRRRDGHPHLPGSPVCLRARGPASLLRDTQEPGHEHTTLLTSLDAQGMGPSMAVEGATTARVFRTYVERLLAPTLKPGQIVVMDNLGAHRPKRIREMIEGRGCELLYLPSYSPDMNPIEESLSKVKHILRTIGARTKDALIEAMGVALGAVSAQEAGGFFASCGYRPPAQQL